MGLPLSSCFVVGINKPQCDSYSSILAKGYPLSRLTSDLVTALLIPVEIWKEGLHIYAAKHQPAGFRQFL